MADKFLLDQVGGETTEIVFDRSSDRVDIIKSFDTTEVVEMNEKMRNQGNNGYGPTGEIKHVANIPHWVIDTWNQHYGVNVMLPENEELFNRLLNDPDYYFLRTSDGRV